MIGPGSNLLLLPADLELQAIDGAVEGIVIDALKYRGAHSLNLY